ncbi:LTA synthase family protein [Nocardioides mesophilus]|uniref:LTA synthase family protein n=1 Tax=Nocardioides mesophilus TaxID=433659 RepID=A0A7G9RCN0_9ACTN|nr:LTA synthase family protein [Nocardioides mesophilus]QNN53355.1 LTA synthase family protein [Nocardioides mesophilus]
MNVQVRLPHAPRLRRASTRTARAGLAGLRAAAPVLTSMLAAVLAYLVLDLVQLDGDVGALVDRDLLRVPVVTLLGSAVIWAMILAVWALAGRLTVAIGVLVLATAVLGFANHMKLGLRLEPLLPSDVAYLSQVGFLTEMVGTTDLVVLGLTVLALGAATAWGVRRLARRRPRPGPRTDRRRWAATVVVRVVVLALSLSFLDYAAHFNRPGNEIRAAYDAGGAQWAFWNQRANYERNGFVGGVLYNLGVPPMKMPRGYSAAAMDDLVRRYDGAAEQINARRSGALDDVNIVVVLSESFSDPTQVKGIRFEGDPIPYTRQVMEQNPSGRMLAQMFGGGTANMEFEALTGMSMSQFAPQMASPYQMLVPHYDTFPSAVRMLEDRGHDAIAIHPFTTQMYRRSTVYPILGFEDFVSKGELQHEETIDHSGKISDASAFDEVDYQIARHDKPLLVNLVTMQNHYPSRAIYDDPIPVHGIDGKAEENAAGYLRGLRHSDDALRDFLTGLRGSSEKTAVIFYGDHQPPFWPQRIQDRTGELGMHSTPYFLWANFPLRQVGPDALTSPIFFLPMLYEAAGAPVTPYYALLTRLHEQITAMEVGDYAVPGHGLVGEDGLEAAAARVLRDYRMVQYDLAAGKRYSLDGMLGTGGRPSGGTQVAPVVGR